jgi:CopG family transcriptional regulator/antitoxin EndoAI
MSRKVVASISLPEEILKKAEKMAKDEHKSRSELFKEAIKEYLDNHQWSRVGEESAPYASAKGIKRESDVEKIIREIRGARPAKNALEEARERFKAKGFNEDTIADAVRWARKNAR